VYSCVDLIRRKVEKAHDQLQFSIFDHGEVHTTNNRCSNSFPYCETPPQVIAEAVDFCRSADSGVWKLFVHASDQRVDPVEAFGSLIKPK
jgi:hypothetical protein